MIPVKYDYYFQKPHDQLGDCPVCVENLDDNHELVAHDNGGEKHPIHLHCLIKTIAYQLNNCPTCQAQIDLPYLNSLANRKVTEISFVKKDLKAGSIVGVKAISIFFTPLIATTAFTYLFNNPLLLIPALIWITGGAPIATAIIVTKPHRNQMDKYAARVAGIATIIAAYSAMMKIILVEPKPNNHIAGICILATLSAIWSGGLGGLLISKRAAKIAAIAGFVFGSLGGSIGVTTRTISILPNAIIDMSLILMAGTLSAVTSKIIDASPNVTRSATALTTAAIAGLILPTYVKNNDFLMILTSFAGVISGGALGAAIGGYFARRKIKVTLYDLYNLKYDLAP